MKIAIVGLSPENHDDAPWKDPEWEMWGLAQDTSAMWCQLLFEMHSTKFMENAKRCGPEYFEKLSDLDVPVYMQQHHPKVPLSLEYPLECTNDEVGDYYGSSIAYMLALAIYKNVGEIGLWGVNLSDKIFDHQRPNLEYLIGFARGRGIKTEVYGPSALMSYEIGEASRYSVDKGYEIHYPVRYGYS